MPQPLSSVKPDASFRYGGQVLQEHQEMAAHIAEVISSGSLMEYYWSRILATISKADPLAALMINQALSSSAAQRAALRAVAELRLSPDDFILFQAVQKATKSAVSLRNNFAHHIWADSNHVPDALLLVDPAAIQHVDAWILKPEAGVAFPMANASKVMVYRLDDLEEARKVVVRASITVSMLQSVLYYGTSSAHAQMRTELLNVPLVAQALQTLGQQQTPKAQP